jgi:hypothetical protein
MLNENSLMIRFDDLIVISTLSDVLEIPGLGWVSNL